MIRYIISIVGASLVGVGVGLCVATGLGADALGVLWEGLSARLLISVGQASLLVTGTCIILVSLISKKELGAATLLNPIVTSFLTDLIINNVRLETPGIVKGVFLVAGIALIGIGSGIAAATNTGKEGYIALSFSLSNKLHIDLARIRMLLDISCFIIGMLLGGAFMLGPIVGILLIGPLLKQSSHYCEAKLQNSGITLKN